MKKNKPAPMPPERLVTIAKYVADSGMTDPAVRGKIRDGHWIEGRHYFRRGRRIRLLPSACDEWYQTGKKR